MLDQDQVDVYAATHRGGDVIMRRAASTVLIACAVAACQPAPPAATMTGKPNLPIAALSPAPSAPILLAAPTTTPNKGLPALREGMPYPEARQIMLAAGFRPAAYAPDESMTRWPICYDVESKDCRTYPELYNQSGTGVAAAIFGFVDPATRHIAIIVTVGEIRPHVSRIRWAEPDEIAEMQILDQ